MLTTLKLQLGKNERWTRMQGCTQTLLTKILDTAIASLYSLKRCTISLASLLFYSVPSSTPFFVPCNTRVCFYRAIRATENFNRCADDTGSAPKPACHFSRCLAFTLFSVFPFMTRSLV